jgi:hypothetical protein
MIRTLAWIVLAACATIGVLVVSLNVSEIVGAFGDGPPYYGRTTNMDKWRNPIPILLAVDFMFLSFAFIACRWALRRLRKR